MSERYAGEQGMLMFGSGPFLTVGAWQVRVEPGGRSHWSGELILTESVDARPAGPALATLTHQASSSSILVGRIRLTRMAPHPDRANAETRAQFRGAGDLKTVNAAADGAGPQNAAANWGPQGWPTGARTLPAHSDPAPVDQLRRTTGARRSAPHACRPWRRSSRNIS